MSVRGLEWLFIVLIVVLLILWDPGKIPKIARAIVEAKKEYEKAASAVHGLMSEAMQESEESDRKLIEMAKELGIESYGKTREEIREEILKKLEQGKKVPEGGAQAQTTT